MALEAMRADPRTDEKGPAHTSVRVGDSGRQIFDGSLVIRWTTILAVATVAIVAGWISYLHAVDVVSLYQHGAVVRFYPALTDGLVYTSSMVLLDSARRSVPVPRLAYWLLGLGIFATLAANVWSGYKGGVPGAIIAAWPAAALVGSYEMLMRIMRGHAAERTAPGEIPAENVSALSREQRAEVRFAADLRAGRLPTTREIKQECGIGSNYLADVQAHLRSKMNGSMVAS